jgi:hypothetical protein
MQESIGYRKKKEWQFQVIRERHYFLNSLLKQKKSCKKIKLSHNRIIFSMKLLGKNHWFDLLLNKYKGGLPEALKKLKNKARKCHNRKLIRQAGRNFWSHVPALRILGKCFTQYDYVVLDIKKSDFLRSLKEKTKRFVKLQIKILR